ncbi:bifunctional 4-hydroxy-2-oxoglutarate aldolase/2-dehydro-3-deoxy-phosphogluconate aldolase [Embleya sp. NPDC050154]|uniref:bifunctional 4-hydroxy-2-oxoglutarate aldolase/2-dehydro-3-deoxy-phosphogluconate aldolase n=1 Tax=Embleya sp. NPDC050154 TaxID=3363988 RepID=UPI0037BBA6E5
MIREASRARPDVLIGAGTVLDAESARHAVAAGARLLVCPTLSADVIRTAHRYGAVVLPGCATPTEMTAAIEAGADAVKVFPASAWTPGAPADVRAALPQLPLIPTGGISLEAAPAWILAGAVAVGRAGVDADPLRCGVDAHAGRRVQKGVGRRGRMTAIPTPSPRTGRIRVTGRGTRLRPGLQTRYDTVHASPLPCSTRCARAASSGGRPGVTDAASSTSGFHRLVRPSECMTSALPAGRGWAEVRGPLDVGTAVVHDDSRSERAYRRRFHRSCGGRMPPGPSGIPPQPGEIACSSNIAKSVVSGVDIGCSCGYGFSRSPERSKGPAENELPGGRRVVAVRRTVRWWDSEAAVEVKGRRNRRPDRVARGNRGHHRQCRGRAMQYR